MHRAMLLVAFLTPCSALGAATPPAVAGSEAYLHPQTMVAVDG